MNSKSQPPEERRFAIAFSFPGEHRGYVEQVANALLPAFGGESGKSRIFYDAWHEEEVVGYAANRRLQKIYAEQSDLIVPFYCQEYLQKPWCGVELRAIEELLFKQEFDRVLPFRFDMVEVPSSFQTDIFPLVNTRPPADTARLILERYTRLKANSGAATASHATSSTRFTDITRIIQFAPAELIGRESEIEVLTEAWDKVVRHDSARPRVLTLVALGGEGKTSLVAHWAAALAQRQWPGCDAAFAWSFYRQGSNEKSSPSSDLFLEEALVAFGDPVLGRRAAAPYTKGLRLAELAGGRRSLLILDGLEPLQRGSATPMSGHLSDEGVAALLKGLATSNLGLCIVTTRRAIGDLKAFWGTAAPQVELKPLSPHAGAALLESLGVNGTRSEREALAENARGHPLTLNLLGAYLRDAYAGDIRKAHLVKLETADDEQGGHAFRAMGTYERWLETAGEKGARALTVLRVVGLFDRPATSQCLSALFRGPPIPQLTAPLFNRKKRFWGLISTWDPLPADQLSMAVARLAESRLLTVSRDATGAIASLDAHPLIREYFARDLRTKYPIAWRAAHKRLFDFLTKSTRDKPEPSLEDLQPLYQAVVHGCKANMHEAAFFLLRGRIQRIDASYSTKRLGALNSDLAAMACFFDEPWIRLSDEVPFIAQAWLFASVALELRNLVRLTESLTPMKTGLEMRVQIGDWRNAAISAGNLSELELHLGQIEAAATSAEQAVNYADRSQDIYQRQNKRTQRAHALYQAGRTLEALALFAEAEEMPARHEPPAPTLISVWGYYYCELLLAGAERSAWKRHLETRAVLQATPVCQQWTTRDYEPDISACDAVEKRAAFMSEWGRARGQSNLDIALAQLAAGSAALYRLVIREFPLDAARGFIDAAADGLRTSGYRAYLPLGLLARALLNGSRGVEADTESARGDLDEAWEVAERGPMPLFMADIHLCRARLFGFRRNYPWESVADDLQAARRLIERHGYSRRLGELEDAESALLPLESVRLN